MNGIFNQKIDPDISNNEYYRLWELFMVKYMIKCDHNISVI